MAYIASKSAIVGMTKVAAKELGPHGIRVNAILPGMMGTNMVRDVVSSDKIRQRMIKKVLLRRVAGLEEVAAMAAFLAGDDSKFCTGATFQVDGGSAR